MRVESVEQMQVAAQKIAHRAKKILVHGDLGAGKTTFTTWWVQAFGFKPGQVSSPTYTYINSYEHPEQELKILHVDMYRISSYEQAYELGIFDLIDDHDYVIVEWPKREEEYVDSSWTRINIEKIDEERREVHVLPLGES